ncbi:Ald3p [Saccharomyces cerevisiae YJM244]|nr:Ald3p [Saccharomyces cerevisiae YJM244]AJS72959.1 Ald3p [Saccharomyces cerevisiae YJM972]
MPTLYTDIEIPQLKISLKQPLGLFINNEFCPSSDGKTIETVNPATGEPITSFQAANEKDVDKAVKAARAAFDNVWSKTSSEQRGIYLSNLLKLIEEEQDTLAALETLDAGKPFHSNAKQDLAQIIELTRYYAGAVDKFNMGETIPLTFNKFAYTLKVPFGVVAQIVPWNYPLAMACWKLQGALAAGNTVIIKPAENTSLSLLYFATLIKKAGFPPGVVNIVPGYGSLVGQALASHMDIDKISFTGSTKVGGFVLEASGQSNLKDVTLECGGKSPALVFEDADLDKAIEWVANGIFFNSGQICTANSRVYVQSSIYDKFVEKFKETAKKEWDVAEKFDPFDEKCIVGPVISSTQYDRIKSYIERGKKEEKLDMFQTSEFPVSGAKGYFIPPTIFTDVPETSKLLRDEIFGPVVVVSKFTNYDDALKLANDTCYGLASAVFTKDVKKAHMFARDIKAGTVWINQTNQEEAKVPFGGFKMSGIGRESGDTGVDNYLQIKSVHVDLSLDK